MNTEQRSCKEKIQEELQREEKTFLRFMNNTDDDTIEEFNSYGLDFSLVESYTFKNQPIAYYRYQLSWGGPSDEIRFYQDGRIQYWYMDWYDGAKVDISDKNWANWLSEIFDISSRSFINNSNYSV